jgi:hypothetical protein
LNTRSWLCDEEIGEHDYFPLEKDSREMTSAECAESKIELYEAQLSELKNWIKNNTGNPELKAAYRARTGLDPLPSRWLNNFKRKLGKKIIKCRLCLKGFKETNQHAMMTKSPTATRTSHRLIKQLCATRTWELWSIDIRAAFLKGFNFETLNAKGIARQPCAFSPPAGCFAMLATISSVFLEASKAANLWCYVLTKSAYGLKDAPLMWFLKLREFLLVTLHFIQSRHDPCLFYKLQSNTVPNKFKGDDMFSSEIVIALSLHVDDLLVTGTLEEMTWLENAMRTEFIEITTEKNHFRHYGVDCFRCPQTFNVYSSQSDYLAEIHSIELEKPKASKETLCSAAEVTEYRSVVAALAWVGVTFAPACAAGSLFQGFLPTPNYEQCRQVNLVLAQIKVEYRPLMSLSCLKGPIQIVTISDSSLGNSSKRSQGGFDVLLTNKDDRFICGPCTPIAYKSSKSKRVASSTSHAETLACVAALEESAFLQTWLTELQHPRMTAAELIAHVPTVQIRSCIDCRDVFEMLINQGTPTPVNRAQTLYIETLREHQQQHRVSEYVWVDTRDNIANALTKFKQDGLLDLNDLQVYHESSIWEPLQPYRFGSSQLQDPYPVVVTKFKPMPPSTKEMQEKVVATEVEIDE